MRLAVTSIVTVALPLLAGAGHAVAQTPAPPSDNCDAIRTGIDARIRASGVTAFSLSVVAADARVTGKVVGTCALGTRKIVYSTDGAPPSVAPKPKPAARILTECKDGSVTMGDCKTP